MQVEVGTPYKLVPALQKLSLSLLGEISRRRKSACGSQRNKKDITAQPLCNCATHCEAVAKRFLVRLCKKPILNHNRAACNRQLPGFWSIIYPK